MKHILPSMVEHITFGKFDLDLDRKPPFEFSLLENMFDKIEHAGMKLV